MNENNNTTGNMNGQWHQGNHIQYQQHHQQQYYPPQVNQPVVYYQQQQQYQILPSSYNVVIHQPVSTNITPETIQQDYQRAIGNARDRPSYGCFSSGDTLEQLLTSIDSWIKSAPQNTQLNYTIAATRILRCWRETSTHLNLDLSGLGLSTLPSEISLLRSWITELDLSNNAFTEFPEVITEFKTKLRVLDLSGNQLQRISDRFYKLIGLDYVDLSRNQLTTLPEKLVRCRMRFLHLDYNRITQFPKDFDNLYYSNHERTLNFYRPINRKWRELPVLDILYLSGGLFALTLQHNNLQTANFPLKILLRNIQHLDLSNNQLTDFPQQQFLSIGYLDISNNRLTSVPSAKSATVYVIKASNNQINNIPQDSQKWFSQLRSYNFEGNPINSQIPPKPITTTWNW